MSGAAPHQGDLNAAGLPPRPWGDLQPSSASASQPDAPWQPTYVQPSTPHPAHAAPQPVAAQPPNGYAQPDGSYTQPAGSYAQAVPMGPTTTAPAQHAPAATQPVAPPVYAPPAPGAAYHPPRAQGAERSALAAVLVFAVVVVGLWAGLGYVHAMAKALASQDVTGRHIKAQLEQSNAGLAQLDTKTAYVGAISENSSLLRSKMAGINGSMGQMLEGVGNIGDQMQQLNGSLTTLQSEITTVADTNASISTKLQTINGGLAGQATQVGQMRRDVQASSAQLQFVPPLLTATNARLTHVNSVVCYMGTKGISNDLAIKISWLGIPNGSSTIHATMIPPGAWGCP